MNIVVTIIVVIVQFIVGQILGFGGASALNAGNGLELVVFVIGDTLGVWGIGALATRLLRHTYLSPATTTRLVGTVIGAAIGVGVILITPPIGLIQIGYPLIGALLGYYLAPLVRR
jgi:hypothetical protein